MQIILSSVSFDYHSSKTDHINVQLNENIGVVNVTIPEEPNTLFMFGSQ